MPRRPRSNAKSGAVLWDGNIFSDAQHQSFAAAINRAPSFDLASGIEGKTATFLVGRFYHPPPAALSLHAAELRALARRAEILIRALDNLSSESEWRLKTAGAKLRSRYLRLRRRSTSDVFRLGEGDFWRFPNRWAIDVIRRAARRSADKAAQSKYKSNARARRVGGEIVFVRELADELRLPLKASVAGPLSPNAGTPSGPLVRFFILIFDALATAKLDLGWMKLPDSGLRRTPFEIRHRIQRAARLRRKFPNSGKPPGIWTE